jgi:hypothetical protein
MQGPPLAEKRLPGMKRRADLTFQHNALCGRHGWLRLTPAYSVKVVEGILTSKVGHLNVLDPFSGTGTTTLCSAMHGHHAVGLEINPFLVWTAKAKVARYAKEDLSQASDLAREIVGLVRCGKSAPAAQPPISNIERWWGRTELEFLRQVMGGINTLAPQANPIRDLLLMAFCRTMIALSNAAFNHQSMSFKPSKACSGTSQRLLPFAEDHDPFGSRFLDDISFVLSGAAENPLETASILLADSRSVPQVFQVGADLLITSPPYPNRISYTRELRPYMYWLGYLTDSREAGELDWRAIGGTWGIATSRVATWTKRADSFFPPYLQALLDRIKSSDAKSGEVLSCYVGKYFEDIWDHLTSVGKVMRRGGEMHYIIGNSKFYDVVVPAEVIYRDMLREVGASRVEIIPLRKRNSKKELVEFDVTAVL